MKNVSSWHKDFPQSDLSLPALLCQFPQVGHPHPDLLKDPGFQPDQATCYALNIICSFLSLYFPLSFCLNRDWQIPLHPARPIPASLLDSSQQCSLSLLAPPDPTHRQQAVPFLVLQPLFSIKLPEVPLLLFISNAYYRC